MRRIILGMVLLIMPFTQIDDDQSRVQKPDPLTQLTAVLPIWAHDPDLGPQVKLVQSQLKQYRRWRHQAETIARQDSLQLAMIGMWHYVGGQPSSERPAKLSQQRVYRILGLLRPTLISLEGSYRDTIDMVAKMISLDKPGQNFLLEQSGAARYLLGHPEVVGCGADEYNINQLHNLYFDKVKKLNDRGQIQSVALERLHGLLLDARSQIAVDRTVIGLRLYHRHDAVSVYGNAHWAGFRAEAQRLGLPSRHYLATDRQYRP